MTIQQRLEELLSLHTTAPSWPAAHKQVISPFAQALVEELKSLSDRVAKLEGTESPGESS